MPASIPPVGEPVTGKAQLVDYLAGGGKPRSDWRIGTEHEKFVFRLDDLSPVPYEGEAGIGAVLNGLAAYGWEPVLEAGRVIALSKGQASVTLEPGGQLELSGAPLETLHQTCAEVNEHLTQAKAVGAALKVGFLGVGFIPKARREDIPWMPKGRYAIMRRYMPTRGSLGLDMMLRTATVQVNLDFSDEADMIRKFRVALALQPVATALWASSPFVEGKPSGFLSTRSRVWTDTDPDRCGILPWVFQPGMGFERYVDWVLDVPMYFVYREGRYIDAAGQSFRDFMNGRLPALPGERPTLGDWADHLTTVFPEVRLKRYLEMRGADGGPWRRLCALPAFWTGLLYDQGALDAAWDEIKDWTDAERAYLRDAVPRTGLATPFRSESVRELALRVLDWSGAGLRARGHRGECGNDESVFLETLRVIAASGRTPAEMMLTDYEGRWKGDVAGVYRDYSY
ncbi:MAG: glutamate--cysteine ligase [Rhodospirillaceae bacterium]|nr:glutamate--cysteine ligase [Rhodospirillaceae bacterium]